MDPAPDTAWIQTATRPLAVDPELHSVACHELAAREDGADPRQLEEVAKRFDRIDRQDPIRRRWLYWTPILLALVLALGIGIPSYFSFAGLRDITTSLGNASFGFGHGTDPLERMKNRMSAADREFVFGPPGAPSPKEAARLLWEKHPDDPALLGDYVARCDPAPDDLLEAARAVDPDNGWFDLLAAGALGADAVEKIPRPHKGPREDRPKVSDWKIMDEEAFEKSLALLDAAVAKPRLESYGATLLKRRLDLLPPEKVFRDRVARLTFAASTASGDVFKLLRAGSVLSARAWFLGEEGDTPGVRELLPKVDALCARLAEQDGNLVHQLVVLAVNISLHEHLREACLRCGMEPEAAVLSSRLAGIHAIRRKNVDWSDPGHRLLRKHGSVLASLALPTVARLGIPPPSVEDLLAGRLTDYALADQVFLWIAVATILQAVVVLLVLPCLRGRAGRLLGARFADLLTARDWLWIYGLGTLAPLACFLGLTRLTPLGGRDIGIAYLMGQPFAVQCVSAIYLVIMATLCTTRWRLGKRAGSLGIGPRRPRWALLPVAVLVACIPAGALVLVSRSLWPIYVVAGLLVAVGLWVHVLTFRALFSRPAHLPYRMAVARALARAFAFAILTALALLPLAHLGERHWLARDSLMRTSAEGYGMSSKEAEAAHSVRTRLLEALATDL